MSLTGDDSMVPTPRGVLAVALIAVLVVSAGCSGLSLGGDSGGGDGGALDSVPGTADAITYVDVDGIVTSDQHRALANAFFEAAANSSEEYDGPTSVDDALADAQNNTSVDLTKIYEVTIFSSSNQSGEYSAAIVETGLSESAFIAALERDQPYNLTEESYNGHTLYVPAESSEPSDSNYVGVLSDGTFVTGTEAAVKDAIDTVEGDVDPISGDVVTAFQNTRDGFIRFASNVPQDQLPTDSANRSVPINTQVYETVTLVSGSQYVDGQTVGLAVTMQTESESAATDVRDATDGAVSLASAYVSEESFQNQLRNVSVTQDGADVTVRFENSVSSLESVIERLVQLLYATGTS
ncbi:MAG: hypothetical protein ABEJ35_02810 [Halobacteriaceae archaeon]